MTTPPADGDSVGHPWDDDLRVLLAAHGAGHEPDRARIRARLDAGLATARRHDLERSARHHLRPPVRRAAVTAASLVAAAAVLFAVIDGGRPVQVSTTGPATGATTTGRSTGSSRGDEGDRRGDDRTGAAEPAAAPPPSAPDGGSDPTTGDEPEPAGTDVPGIRVPARDPDPTAATVASRAAGAETAGGTPGGGVPGSSAPAGGDATPGGPDVPTTSGGASPSTAAATVPTTRASSTTTSPPSTTRPGTTAPPVAGPSVQTGLLPQQLLLGPTGHLDWVVVGSRSDGKAVRMKAGTGRLTVGAPSGAVPTPGLLSILWTGGVPEQSRTDNTTWWTASGSTSSFVIQVAAADNASEIAFYAGSSTSMTVTVAVSGRGTTEKLIQGGYFGSAAKVTVSLTGADRGRDVTITLGAAKGTVSLGAVTER